MNVKQCFEVRTKKNVESMSLVALSYGVVLVCVRGKKGWLPHYRGADDTGRIRLTEDRSDERSGILYAERMIYAHVVDLSVVFYDSDALSFDESTTDEVT